MNAYPIDINKRVPVCKLFNCCLFIRKTIIPQVSISVIMIPFRTVWISATIPYRNNNNSYLGNTVSTRVGSGERFIYCLGLRTGIYISNDRIFFGAVEVVRLIHNTIQVGYSIIRFYLNYLRELISGRKK